MFSFSDIPNLHTHTLLCKHAKGTPSDYCEVSEKHSRIIGFSDHVPFRDDRHVAERMQFSELKAYCNMVDDARAEFPDMDVFCGLEVDWFDDIPQDYITGTLKNDYNIDYFVGSAHYCGAEGKEQYHFSNYLPDEKVAGMFCELTLKIIESGIFAFVAHPDAFMVPYETVTAAHEKMFHEIIRAAVQYDVPLELNAHGLRFGRKYPCRRFWEIASEFPELRTVIGADAHRPYNLFDEAIQRALDMANELKLNICNCQVAQKIKEERKK